MYRSKEKPTYRVMTAVYLAKTDTTGYLEGAGQLYGDYLLLPI
jgi:hypothetical protein